MSAFWGNFVSEYVEAQISSSVMLGGLYLSEVSISRRIGDRATERYKRDIDFSSPYLVENNTTRRTAITATALGVLLTKMLTEEKILDAFGSSAAAMGGAVASSQLLVSTTKKYKNDGWKLSTERYGDHLYDHQTSVGDLFNLQDQISWRIGNEEERAVRDRYRKALTRYRETREEVDYRVIPHDISTHSPEQGALLRLEKNFRENVMYEVSKSVFFGTVVITAVRGLYRVGRSVS